MWKLEIKFCEFLKNWNFCVLRNFSGSKFFGMVWFFSGKSFTLWRDFVESWVKRNLMQDPIRTISRNEIENKIKTRFYRVQGIWIIFDSNFEIFIIKCLKFKTICSVNIEFCRSNLILKKINKNLCVLLWTMRRNFVIFKIWSIQRILCR